MAESPRPTAAFESPAGRSVPARSATGSSCVPCVGGLGSSANSVRRGQRPNDTWGEKGWLGIRLFARRAE
jgi:hypothetical protein